MSMCRQMREDWKGLFSLKLVEGLGGWIREDYMP